MISLLKYDSRDILQAFSFVQPFSQFGETPFPFPLDTHLNCAVGEGGFRLDGEPNSAKDQGRLRMPPDLIDQLFGSLKAKILAGEIRVINVPNGDRN
jgi:hypothetical protein